MSNELYDACVEAGLQIDHHESDLYVECTSISRALLVRYGVKADMFLDQVTKRLWFGVPFMYMPFWRELEKRKPVEDKNTGLMTTSEMEMLRSFSLPHPNCIGEGCQICPAYRQFQSALKHLIDRWDHLERLRYPNEDYVVRNGAKEEERGPTYYVCDDCGHEQEIDKECESCGSHGVIPVTKVPSTSKMSLSLEVKEYLRRHPDAKAMRIQAKDILTKDLLCWTDPPREVVRVYPNGQSGSAPFLEISFGRVCVAIDRDELVTVYRDVEETDVRKLHKRGTKGHIP